MTKNGFNVAAMFTAYDEEREIILTPDIGELEIRYSSWGEEEDGSFYWKQYKYPLHSCTEEELGLKPYANGTNARFFEMIE